MTLEDADELRSESRRYGIDSYCGECGGWNGRHHHQCADAPDEDETEDKCDD